MPYLRFKGFPEDFLREQAPLVAAEFSRTAHVPQEIVKIETLHVVPVTATPRSVEIFMFRRPQETHDRIAVNLQSLLGHFGYDDTHIFFVLLMPSLYYKEGRPLLRPITPNRTGLREGAES